MHAKEKKEVLIINVICIIKKKVYFFLYNDLILLKLFTVKHK